MNILLVGGTGFVGTALTGELIAQGHTVTVLARSPSSIDLPPEVRTVTGDVTDYESIKPAFVGQDVVVNLVALSPLYTPDGGNEMHKRVHVDGTQHVVDAATAHEVDRIVQLSALGADSEGTTAYIRAKGEAETIVQNSALDWVVIRPSVVFGEGGEFIDFTTTLTTPYVTGLPGGGTTRFQPLWVGDLASMLAEAAIDEQHVNQVYELGGPEVLTLADVARLVYQSRGKSLTVVRIPMTLARVGLSVGGMVPGFPMGPDQFRSLLFDNTVEENDITAFGRDSSSLLSLREYLNTEGAPEDSSDDKRRSVVTARSTLFLFSYLALTWQLPNVVSIYSSVIYRVLFIPAYVVNILVYDSAWGLEQLVYLVAPYLPVSGPVLWEIGLLITYYLFAVIVVWIGRQMKRVGRSDVDMSAH